MNANVIASMVTPVSIRSAITIIATVPILVVYPFLQKYFVVGMNVGSIKE
jgi:putative aldouronate transport system permease protein